MGWMHIGVNTLRDLVTFVTHNYPAREVLNRYSCLQPT